MGDATLIGLGARVASLESVTADTLSDMRAAALAIVTDALPDMHPRDPAAGAKSVRVGIDHQISLTATLGPGSVRWSAWRSGAPAGAADDPLAAVRAMALNEARDKMPSATRLLLTALGLDIALVEAPHA